MPTRGGGEDGLSTRCWRKEDRVEWKLVRRRKWAGWAGWWSCGAGWRWAEGDEWVDSSCLGGGKCDFGPLGGEIAQVSLRQSSV